MAIGRLPTRDEIDARMSDIARRFYDVVIDATDLVEWLASVSDANLMSNRLGYAQEDVDDIRAVCADLAQLRLIIRGEATLEVAKDFRVSNRKLRGIKRV